LEEEFNHIHAVVGWGFDVLNVVHQRGQDLLKGCSDTIFHFFGPEPGVIPSHCDDRNVDVRKDVCRRPENDDGADNQNQQGCDVRPAVSFTSDSLLGLRRNQFGEIDGRGRMDRNPIVR
jgi:hypothetical protein